MHLADGIFKNTPLDTSEIPQTLLNIENKSRDNPLAWNGQFSPQLVEILIQRYAPPHATLFDPFLGSGTVLLEAGRAGLAASGTEINPAAVCLSQTYRFINVPTNLRKAHLAALSRLIENSFPVEPLFSHSKEEPDADAIKAKIEELLLTIEDHFQQQLFEAFVILLDFFKLGLSLGRIFATWRKLSLLVNDLPFSEQKIEVYHADARKTPLPDASVDLVITSPPYINVHNYHQQYRESAEALNWDLLRVAKSEIGSNRKHRGNRFLTVIQYCLDMFQVFEELKRICKSNARIVFIVGRESTIRGTKFFNGEIVAEIAYRALGFPLVLRQERVFVNRYGQRIFEDILHFSPTTDNPPSMEYARSVAREVLEAVISVAPDKSIVDIERALDKVNIVQPSPTFDLSQILIA